MLTAKPLRTFPLGNKQIVVCQIVDGDVMQFLDKELVVHVHGQCIGRIKIEGISTANDVEGQIFDFIYSGCQILSEHLGDQTLITDSAG